MMSALASPLIVEPQRITTLEEARAAVARLATHFGVAMPLVRRAYRGLSRAYPEAGGVRSSTALIRLNERDPRGLEACVLHEFAHVVRFAAGDRSHGAAFYHALREVVRFRYGDLRRYAWHFDVETIWKVAVDDGLTERPWWRHERRRVRRRLVPAPAVMDPAPRSWAAMPRIEEITRCFHCRGTSLKGIAVGKQCWPCGQIIYAADGDYRFEALFAHTA